MRKMLILAMFICLILSKPCAAFEPFQKDDANPLPFDSSITGVDERYHFEPFVLYENGLYKAWYSTGDFAQYRIGYATSVDGIRWQPQLYLPFMAGYHLFDPMILKENDKYILYFSSPKDSSHIRIFRIESENGIIFDESSITEVMSPVRPWAIDNVSSPYVTKQGDSYIMFFSGSNAYGWRVGLAVSTDGKVWNECEQNPRIENADGSFLFSEGNTHYLFVHRPDRTGIALYKSTGSISCDSRWEFESNLLVSDHTYDQNHISSSSVLRVRDSLYLYYSGLDEEGHWSLNRASTPIPHEQQSIVIIPGLLASWNKNAILHNEQASYEDWHLLSFVHEYDGLRKSLTNVGLKENDDYFLFPYDWRKSIKDSASDLDQFIQSTVKPRHPDRLVSLVGHSLGGLVATSWFHEKGTNDLYNLITVGSPHQGVVQAYKPVEAGEIERDNSLMWLAQKIVLILNKDTIESDRITLNKRVPSLRDLFPIFPFLRTSSNELLQPSALSIKNEVLETYYKKVDAINPWIHTLSGNTYDTPSVLEIKPSDRLSSMVGSYTDGVPVKQSVDVGDGTVLYKSSSLSNSSHVFSLDHGDLIAKKDGIKDIFTALQIPFDDTNIIEGEKTKLSPSLVFLIQSPAVMQVSHNGQTFDEDEGIIIIPNAENGLYNLAVQGTALGKYTLQIGQLSDANEIWEKIEGEISADPPSSQTDNYSIDFNGQTASAVFPSPTPQFTPTLIPTSQSSSSSAPSIVSATESKISEVQKNTAKIVGSLKKLIAPMPNKPAVLGTSQKLHQEKKKPVSQKTKSNLLQLSFALIISLISVLLYGIYKKAN